MSEGARSQGAGPRVDAQGIRLPRAFELHEPESPPGVRVLALRGEWDLAGAELLRERVAAAAACGKDVVLDLDAVTFLDSSILRELLRADAVLGAQHVALAVACVPEAVLRLFELTRAVELLRICDSVAAALALLAERRR